MRRKKEEEILQDSIIALAKALGYLHFHAHDSRRSSEGFPDLVMVHEKTGALIFVEAKSESGTLSKAQSRWALALIKSAADYYTLRPEDWADGTVEAVLKQGAKRRKNDAV